jgi:phosphoribosyl 1,2-cyclic phosphate phosphodiesterase
MGEWRIVITGCGTSHGNPPWGRPELWSDDPRDHRRRSGAMLLGPQGQVILIDTGPDLMHQLRDPYKDWDGLSYPQRCITRCDAVLLTHDHADHSHGLNELRHLNRLMDGAGITIYGHEGHLYEVSRMYPYCFASGEQAYDLATPLLRTEHVPDHRSFDISDLPVTFFEMSHGPFYGRVSGLRLGRMAYCTDCKFIPEASFAFLQDLDLLVLDMLRERDHVSHFSWDEAWAVIQRLRPRRTVLVHMGHEVRYGDWVERLPEGVEMGYDGWNAEFSSEGPRWDP